MVLGVRWDYRGSEIMTAVSLYSGRRKWVPSKNSFLECAAAQRLGFQASIQSLSFRGNGTQWTGLDGGGDGDGDGDDDCDVDDTANNDVEAAVRAAVLAAGVAAAADRGGQRWREAAFVAMTCSASLIARLVRSMCSVAPLCSVPRLPRFHSVALYS